MTLQLNQNIQGTIPSIVDQGFGIRRNPLTGELISIPQARAAEPNSRLRALSANAEPLETEKFWGTFNDDDNPLAHLHSAPGHRPQASLHAETLTAFADSADQSAQILFDNYIERFEELIPRDDIAEISILETHSDQGVHAEINGFNAPTSLTETVNFQAERWARRRASDLLSDVLVAELVDQVRILINGTHWVAFVPYAATSPLHITVIPKAPRRNLVAMTDNEQTELRSLHQRLATLMSAETGAQSQRNARGQWNALWSMAPIPHCRAVSRMRVDFSAQITAGSSSESPEELAQRLKAQL